MKSNGNPLNVVALNRIVGVSHWVSGWFSMARAENLLRFFPSDLYRGERQPVWKFKDSPFPLNLRTPFLLLSFSFPQIVNWLESPKIGKLNSLNYGPRNPVPKNKKKRSDDLPLWASAPPQKRKQNKNHARTKTHLPTHLLQSRKSTPSIPESLQSGFVPRAKR